MNLTSLKSQTPPEWKYSTVLKSYSIRNNLRHPISTADRQNIKGSYPYYGPTGVLDTINEYRVEGTFSLIGEDGDHFLKYNRLPMTLLVEGQFNVNNHAHLVEGSDPISTRWFYYFYMHTDLSAYLTRQGVGRFKLTKDALSKLPILIPPTHEKSRIVEILGTWDRAIETQDKLVKALTRRKQALAQQLLTGKTRLPGFNEPWEEVKLGDHFKERKERNRKDLPLLAITARDGIVDRDSLTKTDTSSADKSKYLRITPGDIGYNTMRMWQGVSGLSSLEGIVSPAYTILKPVKISPSFSAYLFKLPELVFKFKRYSQGLVDDTLSLKYPAFKIIKASIPVTTEEQQAIAKVLTAADQEITLQSQYLDQLRQQKRGLMQQLLTGKTRVTV